MTVDAPYALDKSGLLAAVAHALRCRSVRRKEWLAGQYVYRMHLFGFESDLERTELLYTSLLVQASYGLAAARRRLGAGGDVPAIVAGRLHRGGRPPAAVG